MPIFTSTPVHPNQQLQTGSVNALCVTEFTGIVEGTIARKAKLEPYIPKRTVKGTNSLQNYAVGDTQLQALQAGSTPDGTPVDFSKLNLVIDTVVLARNIFPLLETFQNNFDVRKEVGNEHGKKIAKFSDQAFMIQGIKAARLAASAYGTVDGFLGGNKVTLTAAGDATDPAKLYKAIGDLLTQMQEKDVEPADDDVILILRPAQFNVLLQAEQIVNGEYITSDGNKLTGVPMFSAWGMPVISSNNLPNTVITGHLLSTAGNGNAYDGDFTKVIALAVSPRALLAGETIGLTSEVFWDQLSKQWFVDSYLSFGVTPNRAEFAGTIELP